MTPNDRRGRCRRYGPGLDGAIGFSPPLETLSEDLVMRRVIAARRSPAEGDLSPEGPRAQAIIQRVLTTPASPGISSAE